MREFLHLFGNIQQYFEENVIFAYTSGSSLLLNSFLPMQNTALVPVYSKTTANHCWPLMWDCIKWTDMQPETAVM